MPNTLQQVPFQRIEAINMLFIAMRNVYTTALNETQAELAQALANARENDWGSLQMYASTMRITSEVCTFCEVARTANNEAYATRVLKALELLNEEEAISNTSYIECVEWLVEVLANRIV